MKVLPDKMAEAMELNEKHMAEETYYIIQNIIEAL